MPILNMNYGANKGGANIGEPTNISATATADSATITWTDGDDLNTIPPATFFKSVLVRKVGSAPTSPSDGTTVVTETVKNTYSSNGYTDTGLTYGTTYYYQVFSYSDLGGITYGTPVSVTPSSSRLPAEYQEVEWIGSSGSQRIDTGVAIDDTTYGFECKRNLTTSSGDWNIMNVSASNYNYRCGFGGLNTQTWQIGNLNTGWEEVSSPAPAINTDYVTTYNYNGSGVWTLNGNDLATFTAGTLPYNDLKWNIFCQVLGSNSNFVRYGSFKLYYMKIWHGTTLLRDYVPCYRKLDSVIGLYDLVNDVFYTNDGSGAFTKGPDAN